MTVAIVTIVASAKTATIVTDAKAQLYVSSAQGANSVQGAIIVVTVAIASTAPGVTVVFTVLMSKQ